MRIDDDRYYNLQKTLTYNADIYCIIGASGKGKTYTTRGFCLKQALKNDIRFVEVCRTKTERDDVKVGYFDKLSQDPEFRDLEFDCRRNVFYCRKRYLEKDKEKAEPWRCVGYIVALTDVQTSKRRTYLNAGWIILDEAIIEHIDTHHTYLRNEWNLLSRVVNSCVREDPNRKGEGIKPHVFLLGNAVDLLNPYFQVMGITSEPKQGYSWHRDKMFLLHYVPADSYDAMRRDETLAGRMASLTGYDRESFDNAFKVDDRYIAKKPPRAKPYIGYKFEGSEFGIYVDMSEGYYYVEDKLPQNVPVFSLTREDDTPNLIAAKRGFKPMKAIGDMYYMGAVLFSNVRVREDFLRAMALFGVR